MISWPASVSAHQLTAAGTLVIADPKDFEKTSAQSERTLLNKLKSNKSKLVVGKPCARCIAVSFSDIGVKVWVSSDILALGCALHILVTCMSRFRASWEDGWH